MASQDPCKSAEEIRRERVAKHIAFLDQCQAVGEGEGAQAAGEGGASDVVEQTAEEKVAAALLEKAQRGERAKAAAEEKARVAAMAALRDAALEGKVKSGYERQQRVLQLQRENELIRRCLEGGQGQGAAADPREALKF